MGNFNLGDALKKMGGAAAKPVAQEAAQTQQSYQKDNQQVQYQQENQQPRTQYTQPQYQQAEVYQAPQYQQPEAHQAPIYQQGYEEPRYDANVQAARPEYRPQPSYNDVVQPKEAIIPNVQAPASAIPEYLHFEQSLGLFMDQRNGMFVDPRTMEYVNPRDMIATDTRQVPQYEYDNQARGLSARRPQSSLVSQKIRGLSQVGEHNEQELKQYVISVLGLDPAVGLEVYQPSLQNVAPRKVEIRDVNGRISDRLKAFERETQLSVIPFKLAGLNNCIVQILDYDIYYDSEGNRYATGKKHKANQQRIEAIEDEIASTLENGEVYNSSIMMEHKDPVTGETYKIPKLNLYEISYILSRYRECGATSYFVNDETRILVGM